MMMAEAFLGADARPGGRGDRFQIVVNVDAEVLADDADGICELDGGPALAPETVRRLACDASIVQMARDTVRSAGRDRREGAEHPRCDPASRARARPRLPVPRMRGTGVHADPPRASPRARRRQRAHEPRRALLVPPPARSRRRMERALRRPRRGARDPAQRQRPPPPAGTATPTIRTEVERANRRHGIAIDPTTCIPRRYGDRFDLAEIVSGLIATERTPTAS